MIAYSERVEMISGNRRMVLMLAASLFAAYVAWLLDGVDNWRAAGSVLLRQMHWVIAAVGAATIALSNQMTIELTSERLSMGSGIFWQHHQLRDVFSATTRPQVEGPEWWRGWFDSHHSTASHVVLTGVRVLLDDGKALDVSSNNPDQLASMINELARLAQAQEDVPEPHAESAQKRRYTMPFRSSSKG